MGKASKTFSKSNGNEFVYILVQLEEGAAKGHTVFASRTTLSNGVEKSIPEEGEEVIVYHTKLPSTKEAGKFVHFFEISTGEVASLIMTHQLLPWSVELIEKYENKWSWEVLSKNPSVPLSIQLIEKYDNKWKW